VEAFLAKVDGVMALGTKPLDDAHPHAHVGEESHARRLYRTNFLASQPGGVLKGLLDVLSLQVRVILEDLVEGGAVSDLAHDHGHRDPHAADARAPAHDPWIESDPVEQKSHPLRHKITGSQPASTTTTFRYSLEDAGGGRLGLGGRSAWSPPLAGAAHGLQGFP